MISDTINAKILKALKEKDEVRLSTLRLLSTALHNAKIDKRANLTEEEEISIVRKEAKKRKETIAALKAAFGKATTSTPDRIKDKLEREEEELKMLEEYLPKQLSREELEVIVNTVIKEEDAKDISDVGMVMGKVMDRLKGRAEGKTVSEIVKEKLSQEKL